MTDDDDDIGIPATWDDCSHWWLTSGHCPVARQAAYVRWVMPLLTAAFPDVDADTLMVEWFSYCQIHGPTHG